MLWMLRPTDGSLQCASALHCSWSAWPFITCRKSPALCQSIERQRFPIRAHGLRAATKQLRFGGAREELGQSGILAVPR
jgi:hypothetical protein